MSVSGARRFDDATLRSLARRVRADVVAMSHAARAAHLGSCLSCVDILVAAYGGALAIDPTCTDAPERDRLILSKGHAAAALYAVLGETGFFPVSRLSEFNERGSALPEHPAPGCVPGVEAATGSLGHGLPLAVGMALAARVRGLDYRVVVVMSDGECNEGSVWEAAQFAPAHELSALTVVIDANRWQATGRSAEIMAMEPMADKWTSFGWEAADVDGHDAGALADLLSAEPTSLRPRAIIARTTKGKGVSYMEDDNNWQYRIPPLEEVERACAELGTPVPAFLSSVATGEGPSAR